MDQTDKTGKTDKGDETIKAVQRIREIKRIQEAGIACAKKVNGYFTVEAALLFPFVMGMILLVIYMLLFQYDRCLMEQSAGVMAMRGCTLQITDGEELVKRVLIQWQEDDKSYPGWQMDDPKISMRGNHFIVSRSGKLKFPFRGMIFWGGDTSWSSSVTYDNQRIQPVSFIRTYRKISGGK